MAEAAVVRAGRSVRCPLPAFGALTVDTSVATLPDAPYVVSYSATDAAGNTGLARRRVHVSNPCGVGEHPCLGLDPTGALCSSGGLCSTFSLEEDVEDDAARSAPVLTLHGPAQVRPNSLIYLLLKYSNFSTHTRGSERARRPPFPFRLACQ
jgi:hypothetical protein